MNRRRRWPPRARAEDSRAASAPGQRSPAGASSASSASASANSRLIQRRPPATSRSRSSRPSLSVRALRATHVAPSGSAWRLQVTCARVLAPTDAVPLRTLGAEASSTTVCASRRIPTGPLRTTVPRMCPPSAAPSERTSIRSRARRQWLPGSARKANTASRGALTRAEEVMGRKSLSVASACRQIVCRACPPRPRCPPRSAR